MAKKLSQVLDWYLDSMGKLGLSVANQKRHYAAAQKLKRELGSKVLSMGIVRKGERLDRMAVREFRLKMQQEGYCDSTILGYLSTASVAISAAFHYRDWELPNPFDGAGKGLKIRKKNREITSTEENEILIAMKQPYRDMAELILETGLRPGEVRYLERSRIKQGRHPQTGEWLTWVEFLPGEYTAQGGQKTREPGKAYLTDRAVEIINSQKPGQYVFTIRGRLTGKDALLKAWHKARRQKGIPHCTPHDCRRTCGIRRRRGGTDLDVIQAQFRHKSRDITESVYAHLDGDVAVGFVKPAKSALSP